MAQPTEEEARAQSTLAERILLHAQFPDIEKCTLDELKEEVKMWRNLWSWLDSPVKYYLARTGSLCGVQVRNYHRYIGVLLETHWTLTEIEIGTYDKVYDQVSGEWYYEKKIVRLPAGQIVAIDWIQERHREKDVLGTEIVEEHVSEQELEASDTQQESNI
jgi:hypothetical protein